MNLAKTALLLGLSLGLPLLPAEAAGFIVVDPAFHGTGRVMPGLPINPGILPVRPPQPGPRPHPPSTPVLKGGVSLGLHLQGQDIKVEITDQVAKTYITQTFVNDTDQNLAGTYLFPLPDDTTFSSFSLHIDGKPVEGKILEASEARQQYEAIVRQMIDPGLLEYADYKTVRARIFPIPAHGTKKVELEYTQLLKAENGLVKYRFPLKGDREAGAGPVDDTKMSVKLSGKQGLRTIWSPSHTVQVERPENNRAKIAYHQANALQDKDFLLYYSLSDKEMTANLLTHKVDGEDGYFLLSLAPPLKAAQSVPKDVVLVADTSGSMQGEKLEQSKKALKYVVTALSPQDRFGIVPFNTDADSFRGQLVQATTDNKRLAVDFIDELEARGGTNIGEALRTGGSLLKDGGDRPAYVVLMTDGEPTVGETSLTGLLKTVSNKNIRLFDFGVGYDVNTRLLNRLSSDHHGTSQYIEPGESLEVAMSGFYDKIRSPMLSDVQLTFSGIAVKDIYPRQVKDIFAGNQVLLLGRYKGSGQASVNISGKLAGAAKTFSFPINFAGAEASNSHLSRLWAMRRIGYLTEVAQENGDTREVIDEIVALSKKHGIITNYTSFLVTDPSENHRLANNRPMPAASPVANRENTRWFAQPSRIAVSDESPRMTDWRQVRLQSKAAGAPGAGGRAQFAAAMPLPSQGEESMGRAFGQAAERDSKDKLRQSFSVSSGKLAFDREKKASVLKEVSQLDGFSGNAAESKQIRSVEGKTFYQDEQGYFVDSAYKGEKTEEISFGSSAYFNLARQSKVMSKYLAVSRKLILVVSGKAYKIS
ncbi:MAG: VWA domain-containing protein [Candidatus Obscuribacter sp.]|nr:VWA domain-containing protein [Candidatus Obscuribacter sp.]